MEKEQGFGDYNFFCTFGWMVHKLGLKGIKKDVYAIIFGFSQKQDQEFYAGRRYMADATGSSLPTIDRVLKELEADGLIYKKERENDGVSHCRYSVYIRNGEGIRNDNTPYQNDNTPYQNDNTHNNNINNKKNNKKENINNKETVEDLFVEDNPEFQFNKWFIENFPTLAKNKRPLKYKTYIMLQSKYPKEKIILKLNAMESMMNFNKKFSDVGRTLWNWLARDYDNDTKGRTNKK